MDNNTEGAWTCRLVLHELSWASWCRAAVTGCYDGLALQDMIPAISWLHGFAYKVCPP